MAKLQRDIETKRGTVSLWDKKKFTGFETQLKSLITRVEALNGEDEIEDLRDIADLYEESKEDLDWVDLGQP